VNNENVISWNLPNFVTFVLMVALLWAGAGVVSHAIRGKSKGNSAKGVNVVPTSGNIVN
jgi:hypothetical protein